MIPGFVEGGQRFHHNNKEEDRRDARHQQEIEERDRRSAREAKAEEDRQRIAARDAEDRRRREQAQQKENARNKAFPRDRIAPTAAALADQIVDIILKNPEIERYFADNDNLMVLTTGNAEDQAQFSTPAHVKEIQSQLLAELQRNSRFTKYFRIVKNRGEVMEKLRRSEGESVPIFDDDKSGPGSYGADQVCQLDVTLYDYNQVGKTTWKVRSSVSYAKSRSVVVNQSIDVN